MDTIDIDGVGGQAWLPVPRFMRGEIDDSTRVARLFYVDGGGHEIVRLDLDFAGASELMIWLNTNIHRLMAHPDDSDALSTLETAMAPQVGPVNIIQQPHGWYVECYTCPRQAVVLTWSDPAGDGYTVACDKHKLASYRGLPALADVQLAMLQYLIGRPRASTVDIANAGPVSWTTRNTGNALSRMKTAGLLQGVKEGQYRTWSLTVLGLAVATCVRYRA